MDPIKDALEKKKRSAMKIEIIINGGHQDDKELEKTSDLAPGPGPDPKAADEDKIDGGTDDASEGAGGKTDEAALLLSVLGKDKEQQQGREPISLAERAKAGMRARLQNLKK